ncbi:TPA: glycosyltransferase, partial [Streptococcus suis]
MKKILMMGMSPVLAGTETFIMTYYRNLSPKDYKIDFLVNTNEKIIFEDEILKCGSKIFRLPRKSLNLKKYYQEIDILFRKISHEYDIFWFNGMGIVNLDYFVFAKKYGIRKRIIHSHSSKWGGNLVRRILHEINKRRLGLYATDFFACSETAADYMFTKNLRGRAKIINNAIDLQKFTFNKVGREKIREELGWETKKIVGNIGRLSRQKNQPFLIDIFNEAYKIDHDLRLLLLGSRTGDDNTESVIQQKINEYGLSDVVKLVGTKTDIQSWLSSMDLFIMTSIFEGLPLSAVEAQANGVPLLLSDSITSETAINSNVHFISLEKDIKYWAKYIVEFVSYRRIEFKEIENNFNNLGFNIKTQIKN